MTVGVRHQLARLLGGSVQAYWMIYVIVHAEGHVGVGAIYTGAAGVDQVLDVGMAAAFEDVDESNQVAIDLGMGIFE